MKKLVFLGLVLLSLNVFAIGVNIGATVSQAQYADTSNAFDILTGSGTVQKDYQDPIYAVNVEVTQNILIGDIGIGASYEQGYKRQDGETFNAIPIYGLVRINLFPILIKPYVTVKYGTTIFTNISNSSTYTGAQTVGLGVGITVMDMLTIEGAANGTVVKRNGTDIGSLTYGLTLKYNVF